MAPRLPASWTPRPAHSSGVTYFDCYGPTILAINESLHEPLASSG